MRFTAAQRSAIGVRRHCSKAARAAMAEIEPSLPPAVSYNFSSDRSKVYKQRLQLLLKNAFIGLVLVLLVLGSFLELKLAFWVTMGIPTSFLGGLLFLPALGVSINIMSMFAFIVSLGIVVDDAIVVGENIYSWRERGHSPQKAATRGALEVGLPVTLAVLTTCLAFMPLAQVEGMMGKFMFNIPVVVIAILVFSLVI